MAKKKNIVNDEFITAYMQFVETNKARPKKLKSFLKRHHIDHDDFISTYTNFEGLDQYIFNLFFEKSLSLLHKSEQYTTYNAQNMLLSFYYTFFEYLESNDVYVKTILQDQWSLLGAAGALNTLKQTFQKYIETLPIETVDLHEKNLNKLQFQFLKSAGWIQFLSLLKFWLNDDSKAYEKTDILIEKLVHTSFELLNIKPVLSLVDLGKFLYNEKFKSKP